MLNEFVFRVGIFIKIDVLGCLEKLGYGKSYVISVVCFCMEIWLVLLV